MGNDAELLPQGCCGNRCAADARSHADGLAKPVESHALHGTCNARVSLEFRTPEVRLMRQMRSVALALALATGLGSLGCMTINKRENDIDRTPVVTTGAGATI